MDPWRGGVVRRSELLEVGVSRREIDRLLATGALLRVRGGWYARPGLDSDRYLAARVGGRLTCVSACRALGMWIPPGADVRPHIAVRSRRAPAAPAAVTHYCRDEALAKASDRLVVDPIAAIEKLARCQSPAVTFVIAESVRERRLLTAEEWQNMLDRMPARLRIALMPASDLSGSGSESEFVRQLRRMGIGYRQQVQIGQDRVDVVLEDGGVVEIDSRAWHDPVTDARRDARLSSAGREVQRFFYDQIWFEWGTVESAVRAGMSRRAARSFVPQGVSGPRRRHRGGSGRAGG